MAEEFQGGVCGGTWLNPNLFSGADASLTSPCSVAQLGGGYDIGWPHQVMKSMPNTTNNNNQVYYDNNSLVSSTNFDSTLDILGFAPSPTPDWNQQNQFCKIGINDENMDSILLQDNSSTRLNYELGQSTSTIMNNSSNFLSQDDSPPTTMTTSSNNSGDSSTITTEVASLCTGFPMSSTTSYLIQTLFEDFDDQSQLTSNTTNDYGRELMSPPCLWPKSSSPLTPPSPLELVQSDHLFNGGMNMVVNNDEIVLSNIRASLLNSLQSRSRAPSLNQKSHKFPTSQATKLNHQEVGQELKKKMNNNNEEPAAKRPRIETPSSLPTFKVRKEKLGDRITALQQLVSPFGKTDTASVLHEAIEYIKFLHDQVHVLTTPYLKDGAAAVQHQQQVSAKLYNNDETKKDLRSRGLCVVPISSTYPVTQETPVDFWTPTFGGTTFR